MAIKSIDPGLCNGCGICVNSCPMDVFRLDRETRMAIIKYPEDCMLCGWCLVDCPEAAVTVTPDKGAELTLSWG